MQPDPGLSNIIYYTQVYNKCFLKGVQISQNKATALRRWHFVKCIAVITKTTIRSFCNTTAVWTAVIYLCEAPTHCELNVIYLSITLPPHRYHHLPVISARIAVICLSVVRLHATDDCHPAELFVCHRGRPCHHLRATKSCQPQDGHKSHYPRVAPSQWSLRATAQRYCCHTAITRQQNNIRTAVMC